MKKNCNFNKHLKLRLILFFPHILSICYDIGIKYPRNQDHKVSEVQYGGVTSNVRVCLQSQKVR